MARSSDETLPVLTVALFDRTEIEGFVFAALEGSVALVPVAKLPHGADTVILELRSPDRPRPLRLKGELAGDLAGGMCPMFLGPLDPENADELLDFLGRQSARGADLKREGIPASRRMTPYVTRQAESPRAPAKSVEPPRAPAKSFDPRRERSTPPPPIPHFDPRRERSSPPPPPPRPLSEPPRAVAPHLPTSEPPRAAAIASEPPHSPSPLSDGGKSAITLESIAPIDDEITDASSHVEVMDSGTSTSGPPSAPPPPDAEAEATSRADTEPAWRNAVTLDVAGLADIPAPPVSSVPPSVINDPLLGRSLGGKYTIVALIGAGGAGSVYRARHVMLQKDIAIKVMHPSLRKDPSFGERFHSEALSASKLDHPNVLRVLDFGEEPDGLLYIAMELLVGTELRALLWQGKMPILRTLDIVGQICAALSAASEVGIVHRDIKPENVVITTSRDDEGNLVDLVKVCDFGLATIVTTDDANNSSSDNRRSIAGTPEYMSPEQVLGEELDGRSDIYAVGIMLYEMITGRLPFPGTTPIEILKGHLRDPVTPPSALVKDVDSDVESVVLRALAKDRTQRPATAREVRAELRAAIERMRRPAAIATPPPPVDTATDPLEDPGSGFGEMFVALTSAVARPVPIERDHPDFTRALVRLVSAARTPLAGRSEISFSVAQRDARDADLLVHTGIGEALELKRAAPAAAETYGPRFAEVLQRRQVVSLALKESVSDADLADMTELLSGPDTSVDALRLDFLSRGLRGVSILFAAELIGKMRKLPWQVELCLSRLARDLRAMPLLRGVTEEQMRGLRGQITADVVHNLERAEDVRLFLENADLITSAAQHLPELEGFDLAAAVVSALREPLAIGASHLLVAAASRSVPPVTPQEGRLEPETTRSTLGLFAQRFLHERSAESDALLRAMQRLGVVDVAELPEELQQAVAAEQLAAAMAEDQGLMFRKLEGAADLASYAAEIAAITRALAVLAKAGDAKTVAHAVTGLTALAMGASPGEGSREELAAGAVASLNHETSLGALAEAVLFGAVPQREPARIVLGLLGAGAARALLAARVASTGADAFPRPRFVAAVREVGRAALPALAEHISRIDPEGDESSTDGGAAFAEDLLRALPEAADEGLGRVVARFLLHRVPAVRRAAATSLPALLGQKAKPSLVHALDDVDEGVRGAAYAGLRAIRGIDEMVVQRIDVLLNSGVQASDELRAGAVGTLAEVREGAKAAAVDVLLRAIKPKGRSIVSLFKTSDDSESVLVMMTVARVLLAIGGPDARKEIERRATNSRGELKKALSSLLGIRA